MEFVVVNQSDLDISELEPLIQSLMSFGQERLGFQDPPSLFLKSDSENASNLLGKTGFYDPNEQEIAAFVDQRHPKDILRSISHELVHHAQNCRGEFDEDMEIGEGYAQKNPKLREMEKEAYLEGNLILRDWEDNHKKPLQESIYYDSGYITEEKESMSTKIWKDRELNTLLMEKWGYKMPVNEGHGHDCAKSVKEGRSGREGRCINHTLLEDGTVTHYTVEFLNEIVENIPVNKLTILEGHDHTHESVREDDEHDDTKTRTMYEDKKDGEVEASGADGLVNTLHDLFGGRPTEEKPAAAEPTQGAQTQGTPLSGEEFKKRYPNIPLRKSMEEQSNVPASGDSDSVIAKEGQSLSIIAKKYGVTVDDIMNHPRNERLTDPNKIQTGQEIFLPMPADTRPPVKEQEIPGMADIPDIPELPPAPPPGTATNLPPTPPPTPPTGTGIEMPDDTSPVEEEVKAPAAMAGSTGGIKLNIKESQERLRKIVREALRKRLKR